MKQPRKGSYSTGRISPRISPVEIGRVDIPIVPFDESACTRPSKLPATREIALLLDAYDIHPTYIHRGRKTERGCRVEHFAEAFRHYLPEFPTRKCATVRKKHDRRGKG